VFESPRDGHGQVTARASGAGLNPARAARPGDRALTCPPMHGRLTRRGRAPAGNRAARFKRVGIVLSAFRQGELSRQGRPLVRSEKVPLPA
jgi:hypothetical protein